MLDDGTTWNFLNAGNCATKGPYWASYPFHGTYTTNGNNISGLGKFYNFIYSTASQYALSGTVSAKNTLDITMTNTDPDHSTDISTFTANYINSYDQPASLTSLSSGKYIDHSALNFIADKEIGPDYYFVTTADMSVVTISGSTVSIAPNINGCSASGTIAPHVTAHGTVGVFDLNLTFSGNCQLGDGTTLKGVLLQDTSTAYNYAIHLLAFTPDNSKGYYNYSAKD